MAGVTFVYPDWESLGVGYLMALCRQAGHDVGLVFSLSGAFPIELLRRLRVDFAEVARKIVSTRPDAVGFSCVTQNCQLQLSCARELKRIAPAVTTVFGGFHPTAVPETVLKEPAVDCVAVGEAEDSFLRFLEACGAEGPPTLPREAVRGMTLKRGGITVGDFREGELREVRALPFPCKRPCYGAFEPLASNYSSLSHFPKTKIIDIAVPAGLLSGEDVREIEAGLRPRGSADPGSKTRDVSELAALQALAFLLRHLPLFPSRVVRGIVEGRRYGTLAFPGRNPAISRFFRIMTAVFHKRFSLSFLPFVMKQLVSPRVVCAR